MYLHIGCGKTGSSALQVWLNNQADVLFKLGVYYPVYSGNKLDAYAITSGNGVRLASADQAGQLATFVEQIAQSPSDKILLSSEHFQNFSDSTLNTLKQAAALHGLRISIIAYARDVYDVVYSLYLQGVKRHLEHRRFREVAMQRSNIQQFDVIARYRHCFGDANIQVLHYDTERKRGLDISMCEALGIAPAAVPPMAPAKVNRSLDVFEAELLRIANHQYVQAFGKSGGGASFSARISDYLIYGDPERETEVLLDAQVLERLRSICQPAIEDLNRVFLSKTPLSLFTDKGKRIVRQVPTLPPAYQGIVQGLLKFFASGDGRKATVPTQGTAQRDGQELAEDNQVVHALRPTRAASESLACNDPRVVNALRDEAIRIEKSDLPRALALMTAAAVLRPHGAGIKKKLEDYQALITEPNA